MPSAQKLARKQRIGNRLVDLCVNSHAGLMVSLDHVTSKQIQDIRMALRGRGVVQMGKNTFIKKALLVGSEKHPDAGLLNLRDEVEGNSGFVFATNCTIDDIREVLGKFRNPAAAKAGDVSMVDMSLPAGPTGMDPSQTSFFQALNIGTKIVKGQIELVSEFPILKKGERVSPSAAILLTKLDIRPFEYGMEVMKVFQDGACFAAAVLDMKQDILIQKFVAGIANMAAFSREIGVPTEAGLPHAFGNAFRNVASLIADIDFTFAEVEEVKKFLADPDAYAAANPVAAAPAAAAAGGDAAPAKAAAAVVEEEEEEDMDFDLFG